MKRTYTSMVVAALAPFVFTGAANATLIGDNVTVGHFTDIGFGAGALGQQNYPVAVASGINDIKQFGDSAQFRVFMGTYLVDVGSNNISVGFSGGNSFWSTWSALDPNPITGEVPSGAYSFNGLKIANISSSSGAPIQSVAVSTDVVGWDASRLSFTADSVAFDWRGLSMTKSTSFDASLTFASGPGGGDPVSVPEPTTLLLLGSGIAGLALARSRRARAG